LAVNVPFDSGADYRPISNFSSCLFSFPMVGAAAGAGAAGGGVSAHRKQEQGLGSPYTLIVQGAVGGIVAALGYDLYRLPFVLIGAPLFKVFPRFGELLLGATEPQWLVHGLGWTYHFSNGPALGIMFLVMASCFRRPALFWGAVVWAVFVEGMLLLTPYASFFGLKVNGRFLFLTSSAHLVLGVVVGGYRRWRRRPAFASAPAWWVGSLASALFGHSSSARALSDGRERGSCSLCSMAAGLGLGVIPGSWRLRDTANLQVRVFIADWKASDEDCLRRTGRS
jgi:hypothetical protein